MACGGDSADTPAATEATRATSAPASPTRAATQATAPQTRAARPTEPKSATPAPDRPTATPGLPTPTPEPTVTPEPTPIPGPTFRPLLDKTSARSDREALIAIGGTAARSLYGWGGDNPLSEWPGVVTDSNGRVTEIEIEDPRGANSGGWHEISWELGNLTNLEVFRWHFNGAEISAGLIPPELGNLTNLRVFSISGSSYIFGRIEGGGVVLPPSLGNLTNLEEFCISGPVGEIPPELGNLVNLELLCIGGSVGGEIPSELGNLVNLRELYILDYGSGELGGEIPSELGNLVNLRELSIDGGGLGGEIPSELGNLVNLETLIISGYDLEGEIPPELGNLAKLKFLSISPLGDLTGCIPHGLRDQLSSPQEPHRGNPGGVWISSGFCADPQITAEQMSVLTVLYDGTDGDNWYDNTNWLSDAPLGEWSGVTTDGDGYVTRLMLYENDLSGGIPAELGNLARLQSLYLYGNDLTGCVPAKLEDQLTDTELGGLSYCGQ